MVELILKEKGISAVHRAVFHCCALIAEAGIGGREE